MREPDTSGGQQSHRVLGIDPGLNITGYGVVEMSSREVRVLEAGVIRSPSRAPLGTRLAAIHRGVVDVVSSFTPQAMAIEELYSHYKRPRTAILMGHARGVICLAASLVDMPIHHYAATHIKKMLTGSGRAPKSQIQLAVCREFGLAKPPEPPDVADAIAAALCHLYTHNKPTQISAT